MNFRVVKLMGRNHFDRRTFGVINFTSSKNRCRPWSEPQHFDAFFGDAKVVFMKMFSGSSLKRNPRETFVVFESNQKLYGSAENLITFSKLFHLPL